MTPLERQVHLLGVQLERQVEHADDGAFLDAAGATAVMHVLYASGLLDRFLSELAATVHQTPTLSWRVDGDELRGVLAEHGLIEAVEGITS